MNYYHPEGVDETTPIDILEPEENENEYREAALHFVRVMSLAIAYALEADCPRTALWGISFALGLSSVTGTKSMREVGREMNLSSGTISNHAKRFQRMADLPESHLMKAPEQVEKLREARNNFCQ
jgi:hypothetical protein